MEVDELVVSHASWIRKTASHFYTDNDDIDDLAGDTIYKILSNRERYTDGRDFKSWVYIIMQRTYITQYNRRKCVEFSDWEECPPLEGYDYAETGILMHRIFSVLREQARLSVSIRSVLLYAKGYCYDEIASIEGVGTVTIKSRIALGRRLLRKAL